MAARWAVSTVVAVGIAIAVTMSIMQAQMEEVREDLAAAQTETAMYEADFEEAQDQADEAEAELDKLKRKMQRQEDEAAMALDAQGDLQTELEAAYTAIEQLQADLATATRRGPSSIRCVDGLSIDEIVSGEIDPCQEWEVD